MSISPPGDIVLDVLRAADPAQQQAAVQKLTRIAVPQSVDSTQTIIKPTAARPARPSFASQVASFQTGNHPNVTGAGLASPGAIAGSAHRQFESMVLQDLVQRMLPANTDATFGQGTAGSVWKSWMAEAVAREVANSGGVGISQMLAPTTVAPPAVAAAEPKKVSTAELAKPAKEPVVVVGSPETSPVGEFIAKLQEIFLSIFGAERSVTTGGQSQPQPRPAFDV